MYRQMSIYRAYTGILWNFASILEGCFYYAGHTDRETDKKRQLAHT